MKASKLMQGKKVESKQAARITFACFCFTCNRKTRKHICARRSKIKTLKAKKNYVNPQNIRFWKNQNAFFIQLTKLFLNPIMHMQCQSITG